LLIRRKQIEKTVKKEVRAGYRTIAAIIRHPIASVFIFYACTTWISWFFVKYFELPVNDKINNFIDFFYFQLSIQSTVGFGDISFVSTVGRLFVYPFSIIVGGMCLLGIIGGVKKIYDDFKRFCQGVIMSLTKNHRIIISSSRARARQQTAAFLSSSDEIEDVIVCSENEVLNLPAGAEWEELTLDDIEHLLRRINISQAVNFNVDVGDDNLTIRLCLHAKKLNPNIHIVVSLKNEMMEQSIKSIDTHIECIVPTPIDVLVKAATVQGSYQHRRDASSDGGDVDSTNIIVPDDFVEIEKKYIALHLMSEYNVNVLYILRNGQRNSHPPLDFMIKVKDIIGIETEPGFDVKSINWDKITIK